MKLSSRGRRLWSVVRASFDRNLSAGSRRSSRILALISSTSRSAVPRRYRIGWLAVALRARRGRAPRAAPRGAAGVPARVPVAPEVPGPASGPVRRLQAAGLHRFSTSVLYWRDGDSARGRTGGARRRLGMGPEEGEGGGRRIACVWLPRFGLTVAARNDRLRRDRRTGGPGGDGRRGRGAGPTGGDGPVPSRHALAGAAGVLPRSGGGRAPPRVPPQGGPGPRPPQHLPPRRRRHARGPSPRPSLPCWTPSTPSAPPSSRPRRPTLGEGRAMAYLDVAGLERLYGPEPRLGTALARAAARAAGSPAAVGIASSKFVAWVAATLAGLAAPPARRPPGRARRPAAGTGAPGGTRRTAWSPSRRGRRRSSSTPSPCRRSPSTSARRALERLGVRTLGAFARLPVNAVAHRYGPAGLHAHRLAQGRGRHPPAPAPAPPGGGRGPGLRVGGDRAGSPHLRPQDPRRPARRAPGGAGAGGRRGRGRGRRRGRAGADGGDGGTARRRRGRLRGRRGRDRRRRPLAGRRRGAGRLGAAPGGRRRGRPATGARTGARPGLRATGAGARGGRGGGRGGRAGPGGRSAAGTPPRPCGSSGA